MGFHQGCVRRGGPQENVCLGHAVLARFSQVYYRKGLGGILENSCHGAREGVFTEDWGYGMLLASSLESVGLCWFLQVSVCPG